jgi:hypothetical protein
MMGGTKWATMGYFTFRGAAELTTMLSCMGRETVAVRKSVSFPWLNGETTLVT